MKRLCIAPAIGANTADYRSSVRPEEAGRGSACPDNIIKGRGSATYLPQLVDRISQMKRDSVFRGFLTGLAIGAVFGLLSVGVWPNGKAQHVQILTAFGAA